MSQESMKKRTKSRVAAVQAIYQLEKSDDQLSAIVQEFIFHRVGKDEEAAPYAEMDKSFFKDLTEEVASNREDVDSIIAGNLAEGWALDRMDQVSHALLRCGTTELLRMGETPAKVVINEYLEAAHTFFNREEISFINKTLDKIARILRPSEVA